MGVKFVNTKVIIGGTEWNASKANYPAQPTIYSGIAVRRNMPSCIEHIEPSEATFNAWIPKGKEDQLPKLDQKVSISGAVRMTRANGYAGTASVGYFEGYIQELTLTDNHFAEGSVNAPGYNLEIRCLDILAKANRIRVGDSPWTQEALYVRLGRVLALAEAQGIPTGSTQDPNSMYDLTRARDVDSVPLVDLIRETAMVGGSTVQGGDGSLLVVNPGLDSPYTLSTISTGPETYRWTGTPQHSRSEQLTNGVVTRTNYWTHREPYNNSAWSIVLGTGGAGSAPGLRSTNGAEHSNTAGSSGVTGVYWTTAPSSGSMIRYVETLSGVTGDRYSAAVSINQPNYDFIMTRSQAALRIEFMSGATVVGTATGPTLPIDYKIGWTRLICNGATATGNFDSIRISIVFNVNSGYQFLVDSCSLVKETTVGLFFDGFTRSTQTAVGRVEQPGILHVDAKYIHDKNFVLNTSETIDRVRIPYAVGTDSTNTEDRNSNIIALGNRTWQERVIESQVAAKDVAPYVPIEGTYIYQRGSQILSYQNVPRWSLNGSLRIDTRKYLLADDLSNLVPLADRLNYQSMYGKMICIDNGPALVSQYFRIKGAHRE